MRTLRRDPPLPDPEAVDRALLRYLEISRAWYRGTADAGDALVAFGAYEQALCKLVAADIALEDRDPLIKARHEREEAERRRLDALERDPLAELRAEQSSIEVHGELILDEAV